MFRPCSFRTNPLYAIFMLLALSAACLPGGGQGAEIRRIARPYALNLAAWELQNSLAPLSQDSPAPNLPVSPAVLSGDIEQVLAQQGIAAMPPVSTRLQEPPLLLVVSPRDRILYKDRLLLLPGLDSSQVEEVESRIDSLGLSALVVKIGGFGAAYPAIVSPSMPFKDMVGAAVEEWAHQYLALRPLGFLYLLDSLGVGQDPNVITINETLAGMIADEIGAGVYRPYDQGQGTQRGSGAAAGFDFDAEMRLTRRQVDELLAAGRIGEAEDYMQARRVFFNGHGYPIRKLNQAYFAFHGIYGQDPGSAGPVYGQMKKLRDASASLAAFVDRVSAMTGYAQLQDAVNNLPR
ncbi:MAG: hypothetical protein NT177_03955 [Chloroflexi bacterium]|nr:hypothetical protein [Chloroflexota bacterium]